MPQFIKYSSLNFKVEFKHLNFKSMHTISSRKTFNEVILLILLANLYSNDFPAIFLHSSEWNSGKETLQTIRNELNTFFNNLLWSIQENTLHRLLGWKLNEKNKKEKRNNEMKWDSQENKILECLQMFDA